MADPYRATPSPPPPSSDAPTPTPPPPIPPSLQRNPARSRHPWRTLFERALGSLPHGAVLSLAAGGRSEKNKSLRHTTGTVGGEYVAEESAATSRRRGGDDRKATPSAAGKIVWANEGFERLAGVDTVDFVGQQLGSLLDLFGVEQGDELAQSFELGTVSFEHRARAHGRRFFFFFVTVLCSVLFCSVCFSSLVACCFCTCACARSANTFYYLSVVLGCLVEVRSGAHVSTVPPTELPICGRCEHSHASQKALGGWTTPTTLVCRLDDESSEQLAEDRTPPGGNARAVENTQRNHANVTKRCSGELRSRPMLIGWWDWR